MRPRHEARASIGSQSVRVEETGCCANLVGMNQVLRRGALVPGSVRKGSFGRLSFRRAFASKKQNVVQSGPVCRPRRRSVSGCSRASFVSEVCSPARSLREQRAGGIGNEGGHATRRVATNCCADLREQVRPRAPKAVTAEEVAGDGQCLRISAVGTPRTRHPSGFSRAVGSWDR